MQDNAGHEKFTRQNTTAAEAISGEEQERLLAILNFWHKLEFFIPFDLDQRRKEADEGRIRWLHSRELTNPSREIWSANLPDEYELKGFDLYLGIFDKGEIAKVCEQVASSDSHVNSFEEDERTDMRGDTCFAKLTLNSAGELTFKSEREPISVSTVPWALGTVLTRGFGALNYSDFERSKEMLSELLQNFQSNRKTSASRAPDVPPNSLRPAEVLELHQLFCDWASYSPADNRPIGMLEIRTEKKKPPKPVKGYATSSPATKPPANPSGPKSDKDAKGEDEIDNAEDVEPTIDILNSFFIQDLERAAATVRSGFCPRMLKAYLTPLPEDQRLNLDTDEGYWTIFDTLHPKRVNRGHWLDESDRAMSLMQQFAINLATESAGASPHLFSVNGPPGTGKTTLLQEVFTENIVRRARALSRLRQADDAFVRKRVAVRFSGESNPTHIVRLRPELTGYEMVVASSNNAAVENISRELPRSGKLGESWKSAKYLQPVAHKIAAQRVDGSCSHLKQPDVPWGLISCALGNSKNRSDFKERLCFMKIPYDAKPTWQGPDRPQTIYEWISEYRGSSFAEAAATFKDIDQKIQQRCDRLAEFAELVRGKLTCSGDVTVSQAESRVADLRAERDRIEAETNGLKGSRLQIEDELSSLHEEERLIERSAPGWWAKLRGTPAAQKFRTQVQENAAAQLRIRQQISALDRKYRASLSKLDVASTDIAKAERDLLQAEAARSSKEQAFGRARQEFPGLRVPDQLSDLRADCFQKKGLWHDRELAGLRSSLFASALALHEAWLSEVARKASYRQGSFHDNIWAIKNLLSNKRPDDKSHVALIWQSLFMIVPVVSTTFASFARQTRDHGAASLAWLFIDEAGQAVPQAGVGALWRAQRAVVVGDPLQIEPVFTLPSRFITTLAELSPHTTDGYYAPHRASIQKLADDTNRCGIYLSNGEESPVWIGSPLRVHRRCIDPMFSWSNRVAYDGKMVFGLKDRKEPNRPPIPYDSVWIEISGKTSKQQVVPEQTEFVVKLMTVLYKRYGTLPCLYVISPFRAIKKELNDALTGASWTDGRSDLAGPTKKDLKKWCKERIGTVHTFQGKEEDTVIRVLGADQEHSGAATWASSKPNILNVALTRAKRRFYIVGDRQLWGHLGPFQISVDKFGSIDPVRFLAILQESDGRAASATS